jgi:hypothetical protein
MVVPRLDTAFLNRSTHARYPAPQDGALRGDYKSWISYRTRECARDKLTEYYSSFPRFRQGQNIVAHLGTPGIWLPLCSPRIPCPKLLGSCMRKRLYRVTGKMKVVRTAALSTKRQVFDGSRGIVGCLAIQESCLGELQCRKFCMERR